MTISKIYIIMYMFSNIKRASQTTLHCDENFLAESLIEQVNNIRRHKNG